MPTCPRCGGQLRLRTARRGPNAGNQFYGCSNWQRGGGGCNFTIDRDEWEEMEPALPEPDPILPHLPPMASRIPAVPLPLHARAKFRTHKSHFLQTLASPRSIVGRIQDRGDDTRQAWEYFSTWRLDSPLTNRQAMDKLTRTVLQVALKILTRGRLTVLSPLLEKRLSETFGLDVADALCVNMDETPTLW